jgi:D-3-phosphoglycerate dehydrogenase
LRADELRSVIGDVDGFIAGLDEIDVSVFDSAPKLRVVARYGVGTDNVDLKAAAEHGVVVTNTPGANAEAVAELAIGFFFALARSIPQANQAAHAGTWRGAPGIEVAGRTVGILGFGRIGQSVAKRALGLGCVVLAYDPFVDVVAAERLGVRLAQFEEVVSQAHFLTLHLPVTFESRDMVNRDFLERMRRGAYLVNTARGELIVEDDLRWALEIGQLAGAALDTLREEPPSEEHPLLGRRDVILTPHMGAHTIEAATGMGRATLDDLLAVLSGRPARFVVHPPSGL